jgi:tRNA threonylcarbamoyladenosine biosynthesis protein TsaB
VKLLTLDTATSVCSVALTAGEQLVAELTMTAGKGTAARLVPAMTGLLQDAGWSYADLDGFGVTVGPGAFTGLRVGIATVKGLALATDKPVVGISSLGLLAMNIPWAAWPVCTLFDARKNEVYAAIYAVSDEPTPLLAETVLAPDKLLDGITGPTIFVGDGALRYRELISQRLAANAYFAPSHLHWPRAAAGAELVRRRFAAGLAIPPALLAPLYIRPSEAELAKARH